MPRFSVDERHLRVLAAARMPQSPTLARRYSAHTLKILWGRAAGRCAVPDCRIELFADAVKHDPIVVIGDIAHIEASSDEGPRANRRLTGSERNKYDNLILLCKNCHAKLDGQKNSNTVAAIRHLRSSHEGWVRAQLPERGRSLTGWNLLILQGHHPIDAGQAEAALAPDYASGKPTVVSISPANPWQETFNLAAKTVQRFLGRDDPFDSRFAIFPLAPVSACLAVGYLLTNRPRVRLFQFHRASGSWFWLAKQPVEERLRVVGLPKTQVKRKGEVVVCFHISARISRSDLPLPARSLLGIIDVTVREPSVHWLKSSKQLEVLGETAGRVFESLSAYYPNASCLRLLYAGPAPGAVAVGQQLNPTMTPPVQLCEFNRSRSLKYEKSILLMPPNE